MKPRRRPSLHRARASVTRDGQLHAVLTVTPLAATKETCAMTKTWVLRGVVLGAITFGLLQLVPYGRPHTNPPVTQEPAWPEGAQVLAERACFDCHSNQTVWPWYSHVAPMSWLVFRDTMEGRKELNFSEWDKPQKAADEAAKELREEKMPMAIYLPLHHDAVLSPEERVTLISALDVVGRTALGAPEHSER
jgi:hypothetical protein